MSGVKFFLILSVAAVLAGVASFQLYLSSLPPIQNLESFKPNIVTKFYSHDGEIIKTFTAYTSSKIDLKDVPENFKNALIATEDKNFYKHNGYDIMGLARGLVPLKDGKPEQKDGKTQVYPISSASDFFEQVGRNTNYIINPEEILAENFAAVMLDKQQAKTPELYEKIRVELKK